MLYEMSLSEIQDQQVVTKYSRTTRLLCGQAIHNHNISIFPVTAIRCIGCNRSNSCHLATELVDMWSLKNRQ